MRSSIALSAPLATAEPGKELDAAKKSLSVNTSRPSTSGPQPRTPLYYSRPSSDQVVTRDSKRISWDNLFPNAKPDSLAESHLGEGPTSASSSLLTAQRPLTSPAGTSSHTYGRSSSWMQDPDAVSIRSHSSASSASSLSGGEGSSSSPADTAPFMVAKPSHAPKQPFLPNTEAAKNCSITVDDSDGLKYLVRVELPGFAYEHITVALKRNGSLHILADRWSEEQTSVIKPSEPPPDSSAHFERMVELGRDAIGGQPKASWKDSVLTVSVTKRQKTKV